MEELNLKPFKWNGKNYHIEPLTSEDQKRLKELKLSSIVSIGKVVDTYGVFKSWVYSINQTKPPCLFTSIDLYLIKLFPYREIDSIGFDRTELTKTQFQKELDSIKKYHENRPLNDVEAFQEASQSSSNGSLTAYKTYLKETHKIRPNPSRKSFRAYFEEEIQQDSSFLSVYYNKRKDT